MGNSLRDQLLKAGLTDRNQVRQAKQAAHKQHKRQRGNADAGSADSVDNSLAQQAAAKRERDRALSQEREAARRRREQQTQLQQLINAHQLPLTDGDLPFHFTDNQRVKRLLVTEAQRRDLTKGRLAVVRCPNQGLSRKTLGGTERYALMPLDTLEKIRQRDAGAVVYHQSEPPPETGSDADDPYAAFQVPDDLIW